MSGRLALTFCAVALAGAGLGACSGNRNAQSQGNQGVKASGPQQPNPGGLVSTGTPQPTVTQPERPLTVPTQAQPASPSTPGTGP